MKLHSPISCNVLLAGLCLLVAAISSCTQSAMLNAWAPAADFSTSLAGTQTPRGIIVGFINNTPYRAIFTYGAYNQDDKTSLPTGYGQLRLEGNTANSQISQPCRKTFSVGGDELIRLITDNENDPNLTVSDPRALVRGVYFSNAPLGDPLEADPTEGTAEGLVVLNGVDFSCARTDIREPRAPAC